MAGVRPGSGGGAYAAARGAALDRALVFIGFMGAGKTTAAREVARALNVSALDSDALLEERLGHSIAEEFELGGEEAFRVSEEELVCELLADAAPGSVLALGGGSVLSARVREALEPHLTVLLDIDVEVAWARCSGAKRPLARDRDAFAALHEERRGLYQGLADAFLPVEHRRSRSVSSVSIDPALDTPAVAVRALPALGALAAAPSGTRLLWATAESGEYPVFIGAGLLANGGWSDAVWPVDRSKSRGWCVSDETVAALHAPPPDAIAALVAIPPGERHKTLASAERVWRGLLAGGMTRADHVIALGGGVVGDLAGFCAATYQRGVPVVHVPTTLVAQVDSAYGGKTGVDLPDAKNYIGVYHQPAGVLVDPDTLATLEPAELAAGWVEVLKTALIAGGSLWERVSASSGSGVDERTILECVRTKLAVVAADERDAGRRQVLNLGHTIGHAIETVTGYTRYRHGEAVGLGLLAALRLSGADDLRTQVRELLLARDLPVTLGGRDAAGGEGSSVNVEEILSASRRDKKRVADGTTPFVLLGAPGEARIGCEVSEEELRMAVKELI